MGKENIGKAILCGIVASFFLSSTFVINSLLAGSGGYWAWTAALRSLFLIPILISVLFFFKQLKPLFLAIIKAPWVFLCWGNIGFGVLYTSLAIASLFSPGWMVAAAFQLNILAGIVLAPVIYPDQNRKRIPRKSLLLSVLLVLGIFVMQLEKLDQIQSLSSVLFSLLIVLLGATVWPLGNRKLLVDLEKRHIHLNATQRVLGMSIGSLPLLTILCVIAYYKSGLPSVGQVQASAYSALFSGFLGGVLFYQASQMVKRNTIALATIEATQVFEIFFTLIGEMILKGTAMPGNYGLTGMLIVMVGMLIHVNNALNSGRKEKGYQSDYKNDVFKFLKKAA